MIIFYIRLQERGQERLRAPTHQRAGETAAPEDVQQPQPEAVPVARALPADPVAGAVLRVPLLFVFAAAAVRRRPAGRLADQPTRVRHISGQRERLRHDALELEHVRHMASTSLVHHHIIRLKYDFTDRRFFVLIRDDPLRCRRLAFLFFFFVFPIKRSMNTFTSVRKVSTVLPPSVSRDKDAFSFEPERKGR